VAGSGALGGPAGGSTGLGGRAGSSAPSRRPSRFAATPLSHEHPCFTMKSFSVVIRAAAVLVLRSRERRLAAGPSWRHERRAEVKAKVLGSACYGRSTSAPMSVDEVKR
jgi:hypothetical protein